MIENETRLAVKGKNVQVFTTDNVPDEIRDEIVRGHTKRNWNDVIQSHNRDCLRQTFLYAIKKFLDEENINDAYKAMDMYAEAVRNG